MSLPLARARQMCYGLPSKVDVGRERPAGQRGAAGGEEGEPFFRFGHAWRTSADAMAWQAYSNALDYSYNLSSYAHYLGSLSVSFLVCIAASTCSHYYYVSLACADQTNNNNMRYNLPRWGVVARDAAISQRAMPQRVACDSRSGPAACKDVARAVAPRGVVRICLRCVPKSQTVPPIFRRQRLAGRPVAFAPRLLCARRPRQRFVRCCAAPRRPNMPATRAQIANHSSDSPLATLRCPAGRSRLTSALRPSPAVSRGVVARDVVISPCAAPRLLCFHRPRRRLA